MCEIYTLYDVYRKRGTLALENMTLGVRTRMNVIVWELICISVWHYASLRKKGMNCVVHDVQVY